MHTNLFAYTAPGADYPEYISINREDDGRITITVRGPKRKPGELGNEHSFDMPGLGGTMTIPADEFVNLARAATLRCCD
jgi:hypothetical protein